MYGMYPNDLHWRINSAFILVIGLGFMGYFFKDNLKKYLTLYYVVIYPFIALLFIYFFISGGPIFFDFSYGIIALVVSIIIGFFIPSKFKMYYFIIVPITNIKAEFILQCRSLGYIPYINLLNHTFI